MHAFWHIWHGNECHARRHCMATRSCERHYCMRHAATRRCNCGVRSPELPAHTVSASALNRSSFCLFHRERRHELGLGNLLLLATRNVTLATQSGCYHHSYLTANLFERGRTRTESTPTISRGPTTGLRGPCVRPRPQRFVGWRDWYMPMEDGDGPISRLVGLNFVGVDLSSFTPRPPPTSHRNR